MRIERPSFSVPIALEFPGGRRGGLRRGEPVTVGIPLPRGVARDPRTLGVFDADGRSVPVQLDVTETWPDGSIRWLLADFRCDVHSAAGARYELRPMRAGQPPLVLAATADDGSITVCTGAAMYRCQAGTGFPFADVCVGGRTVVDPGRSGLFVEDSRGRQLAVVVTGVTLERNGPVHAVVRCDGYAGSPRRLVVTMRLHFFKSTAAVRVALTLWNPRKADHPGGRWPLGQRSSVFLRRAAFRVALGGDDDRHRAHRAHRDHSINDSEATATVRCSEEPGAPFETWSAPFELYQDSSGGPRWNSPVHVNRHGTIPTSFRGYRVRGGDRERSGLRACPAVTLERGSTIVGVAVSQFWQNCPKAIESDGESIDLALFPAQFADLHELQGGEQKTHTFVIAFGSDAISDGTFDWARTPLVGAVSPDAYAAAEALPFLTPVRTDPHADYLRLVSAVVDGPDTVLAKREAVDEYGWRSFGDLWADHEAVFAKDHQPFVSHYNNQYDAIAGFACQFMRSGDTRYWTLMDDLARHVVDIDVYHTDEDKPAYNHGQFWHTCHYTDAGASTHRAYPMADGVCGGGPGNEHDYSTGLMLHYFLTGDPLSRQTILELASWVVAMDDGKRSRFRWVDDGATGLASATVSPDYHGPGRGAAYSINTLLDAHRLSGDAVYLAKAEELVRRCVHPGDDPETLELLDAERRWSYTVFLQVLARYLDYLAERGELGAMYAYGRETLLRYARWMADRERPYLDHPEQLEYPTETWAAQDLRKAAVFALAARHTSGSERVRFFERARWFFRYATTTLDGYATKTLMRPLVLLMTNGYLHAYFAAHPESSAPAPAVTFVPSIRTPFVPQRARVKRFVVQSTLIGTTALAGVLLALAAFACSRL